MLEQQETQPTEPKELNMISQIEEPDNPGIFKDVNYYPILKVDKLYGGLPIFTAVPTYTGRNGEIVFYFSGSDYRLYSYLNGGWRKIGDINFQSDHGGLTGLTDDDHTQYSKADGSRAFTGTGAGFKDEDDMASNSATAAPSQQSVKAYVDNNTNKINVTHSDQTYLNSTTNTTNWFSISIPANTLGTNNAVRLKAFVDWIITNGDTASKQIGLKYGSTDMYVSPAISQSLGNGTWSGYLDILLVAAGGTSSQEGSMSMYLFEETIGDTTQFIQFSGDGTASEDRTGSLNLIVTVKCSAGNSSTTIIARHIVVEKIH